MPMLTSPTTTTTATTTTTTTTTATATAGDDAGLARPDGSFRVRLAAALAAARDGRPLVATDRASAPTHRYRAMA